MFRHISKRYLSCRKGRSEVRILDLIKPDVNAKKLGEQITEIVKSPNKIEWTPLRVISSSEDFSPEFEAEPPFSTPFLRGEAFPEILTFREISQFQEAAEHLWEAHQRNFLNPSLSVFTLDLMKSFPWVYGYPSADLLDLILDRVSKGRHRLVGVHWVPSRIKIFES